jgi:SSS family solute:Na+ symporter/sodium/pantothenate symporter
MMLAWVLFLIYMAGTAWLGWLGHRRTGDFRSFAIGRGDLSPLVVGITLAASTASAATFIINPGFIYVDGLSAWIHMVPATGLGFCGMLAALSFRFRRLGEAAGAVTIPHWIGRRYGSSGFALYFAVVNLLAFAFVVLLVGGTAIVMQRLLGLSNTASLLVILIFVTSYVFVGGTYAHVFTNLLQGGLMFVVALLILGSGVSLLFGEPSFAARITAEDPDLLALVNTEGLLFNDVFSIYVAGLVVGATIVCQPHILTKALYVKTDAAVRNYLVVFTVIFGVFLLLGTVGFFARLTIPPGELVDATTGAFRQDLAMTVYLQRMFSPALFSVISVVMLAAAMSTLDGVLVGISTITANDLVLNLLERVGGDRVTPETSGRLAHRASQIVLVVLAVITFLVCLDPPRLLGIFGQVGVYGMAVAALCPLLAGVLFEKPSLAVVWAASVAGLAIHLGLYFLGTRVFPGAPFTFANPGVTLTLAVLVTVPPALLLVALVGSRRRGAKADSVREEILSR